jgi:hypothetical protein
MHNDGPGHVLTSTQVGSDENRVGRDRGMCTLYGKKGLD